MAISYIHSNPESSDEANDSDALFAKRMGRLWIEARMRPGIDEHDYDHNSVAAFLPGVV